MPIQSELGRGAGLGQFFLNDNFVQNVICMGYHHQKTWPSIVLFMLGNLRKKTKQNKKKKNSSAIENPQ